MNMSGGIKSAFVGTTLGALVGVVAGYYATMEIEKQKEIRETRTNSYIEFIDALSDHRVHFMGRQAVDFFLNEALPNSQTRDSSISSETKTLLHFDAIVRSNEAWSRLLSARTRILLYGSPEVVEKTAEFFRIEEMSDHQKNDGAIVTLFFELIEILREDSPQTYGELQDNDICILVFDEDDCLNNFDDN